MVKRLYTTSQYSMFASMTQSTWPGGLYWSKEHNLLID